MVVSFGRIFLSHVLQGFINIWYKLSSLYSDAWCIMHFLHILMFSVCFKSSYPSLIAVDWMCLFQSSHSWYGGSSMELNEAAVSNTHLTASQGWQTIADQNHILPLSVVHEKKKKQSSGWLNKDWKGKVKLVLKIDWNEVGCVRLKGCIMMMWCTQSTSVGKLKRKFHAIKLFFFFCFTAGHW